MSERTYEHTFDMDELVTLAARYEAAALAGQNRMLDGDDTEALYKAIDALEIQRDMFFLVVPEDVREEFQTTLTERVLKERADA